MSSAEFPVSSTTRITHYWVPVALMLMFQYTFSTGAFSSGETSKVIVPILKFILRDPTQEQLVFWHHVIRKAAHVTEYCILGLLVYRALRLDVPRPAMIGFLTTMFVIVAAAFDEYHQSFVASRGASVVDVGWDCVGGLIAVMLSWGWKTSRPVEK